MRIICLCVLCFLCFVPFASGNDIDLDIKNSNKPISEMMDLTVPEVAAALKIKAIRVSEAFSPERLRMGFDDTYTIGKKLDEIIEILNRYQ